MPGNTSAMPTQQRVWGDQPVLSLWPRQRLGDRSKKRSVIVGEPRPLVVAGQDRELVTQHDDLKFFGPARPNGKARHRSNEAIQDAKHTPQDQTIFGVTKRHDRVSGTHTL